MRKHLNLISALGSSNNATVRRRSPDRAVRFDRKVFSFNLGWETFGRTTGAVRRPAHNMFLSGALVLLALVSWASAAEPKPNIIVFLVDDMGWQDTSVPFWTKTTPLNKKFHTPSMERLASAGMKFTQAYANPVCTPTRVSLLTGLNAARHRVTNWTRMKDQSTDAKHPRLKFPEWNVNGLSPVPGIPRTVQAKPLPAWLREAGYRTIHVGKAHFGAAGTPGADPKNLGFDVNIGGQSAGGPGSYLGEQDYSAAWRNAGRYYDVPGLTKYHGTDTFLTEALTVEALKAVDQARSDQKPFFLYMSHYAVHVPFAPDKRFYEKYKARGLDHTEAMYAALIEGMDKSLGDIMTYLDQHQHAGNTILLFMSDNGGYSAGGRGGKPHTHNLPLSSGKGSAREGGIREPMIVRWPGVVKPGSVCDEYLIIEDFFPTILEMAGVKHDAAIDGISFVPLLRGENGLSSGRALYWHYPNNWGHSGPGIGAFSAIRKGDWKYIFYYDPDRKARQELFNLRDDIGETKNQAGHNPATLKELRAELKQYLQRVHAQFPANKKTGKTITLP
jgi:arylsulfatase A-like enzyme